MEYKRLGDYCTITSSKRIFADQYEDCGIPFFRSREIIEKNNCSELSEPLFISKYVYEKIKEKFGVPQRGDLLLTSVGTIGIPYIVKDECFYFKDGNLTWMKDFSDELSSQYLYFWISSSFGRESLIVRCIGSSQSALTIDILKKYKFYMPDRITQDKVVAILLKYNSLIENNNKRIKVLEQIAENLYKEWFVRFRFPGHENSEFENEIPKGWEYVIVEELSDVLQRGISPDYNDEGALTVISQKCIRKSIMDIKEARKQTKAFKPELNLCDGDTVICSTGTGTLGRVGQVYGTYPNTTFDSHVTLVRAKPNIGKHFLFWSLKSMQIWFMNMGIGSTNQQELYRNTIRKAKILRPDYELINKFDSVIEPIHQEIVKLIKSQDNLIKQRDLLLPRLMSGKLEV